MATQIGNSKKFGNQTSEKLFMTLRGCQPNGVIIPQSYRVRKTNSNSVSLQGEVGGVGAKTGLYEVKAVLTPNRQEKRQNGRRMKENEEPSFTLTGQDVHGVMAKNRIRRLTPIECARLQGFPDDWHKGVSEAQAYRAYGNAVSVPVVKAIAERLLTPKGQHE